MISHCDGYWSWWRHQMETLSALLAICVGNSLVPGEFPAQRPVTRSFRVFFDLSLNKPLSKQSWGWWFETLSCSLWRHGNVVSCYISRAPVATVLLMHPCIASCLNYSPKGPTDKSQIVNPYTPWETNCNENPHETKLIVNVLLP